MKQQSYQSAHNVRQKEYPISKKVKREKSITECIDSSDTFFQQRLNQLNSKIQIQNQQIKERNSLINELQHNFAQLANILKKQKKEKQDLLMEADFNQKTQKEMILALRQKEQSLSDENLKLKSILMEQTQTGHKNRRENQILQAKLNELSLQIKAMNEGMIEEESQLSQQVQVLEKQLNSVKELNLVLVQENRELKYKVQQNEEHLKQRNRMIGRLEEQKLQSEQEIKQERKQLRKALNTIEELKNTIQVPDMYSKMRMNQEIKHKESLKASKRQQNDLIEEIARLKNDNGQLLKGKTKVQRENEKQKSQKKRIQKEYNRIKSQTKEEMKRIEKVAALSHTEVENMRDVVKVIEIQKQQKERLEARLREVQPYYEKYKKYFKQIQKKEPNILILSAREVEDEKQQIKKDIERQAEIKQKRTIKKIHQIRENFHMYFENVVQSIEKIEADLVIKMKKIDRINNLNSKLSQIRQNLKDIKNEKNKIIQQLKGELKKKDQILIGSKKEEERLRTSISLLKQKIQLQNKDKEKRVLEYEKIKLAVITTEKKINSYAEELESKIAECSGLQEELTEARKQRDKMIEEGEKNMKRLQQQNNELEKQKKNNKELWVDNKKLKEEFQKCQEETEEYLLKTEKQRKCQLQFTIKQINKKYSKELRERAYQETYLNNLIKQKLQKMVEDHNSLKKQAVFYKQKFQELHSTERLQRSLDELPTKSRRERIQLQSLKKRRKGKLLKTSME